jgi:VanZ family protein
LKKIGPYLLAISWLIMTTILLCLPGSSLPREDWLSRLWIDKWVHILLFMVLVILWCRGISRQGENKSYSKFFIYLGLLALIYGFIMELIQGNYIPNRSFDTGDLVADAAGCIAGVIISSGRYIKK